MDNKKEVFTRCCPELFDKGGDLRIFQRFMCPISIVEAEVKEYVVDEYDSVELFVLRLYAAGIRVPEDMAKLTGIDFNMINKLLTSEKYTYGHIHPLTGQLTESGEQTLKDNTDPDNLFQHALYDVKRELQVEALTGTVIKPEAELIRFKMSNFSEEIKPNIFPKGTVAIDEELESEINRNLQYYIDTSYLKDGNTIREIGKIKTKEVKYRSVYLASFSKFRYPLIVLSYDDESGGSRKERVLCPTAIAASDFKKLKVSHEDLSYMVREDKHFTYLLDNMKKFESQDEDEDSSLIPVD